jgi:hypothetical protein
MGSEMIDNVAIPSNVRFELARVKEHLIVYMWEQFIKGEIFRLEMQGLSAEDLLEVHSELDLLECFAHFQIGYWEGVNEANENNSK